MKIRLLLLSLATFTSSLFAHEHHSGDYDISVYRNYKDFPVSKRLDLQNLKTKVNAVFPKAYTSFDKLNGKFTAIYGKSFQVPGATIERKIDYCFKNQLSQLGVQKNDWVKSQETNPGFAQLVHYKQILNNHEVVFSRLSFKFSKDGSLLKIQMKDFGTPKVLAPTIALTTAQNAAVADLQEVTISSVTVKNNWVWFPVPTADGYDVVPAWEFDVVGQSNYTPILLHGYIDATNGTVLYRENQVKETVDLTVKGVVYKNNYLSPPSIEPLSDMLISMNGNNYYTDTAGYFSDTSLSTPTAATLNLFGNWANVYNHAVYINKRPSYPVSINTIGTTVLFDTIAPFNDRVVNAFYHVNRVHDFMKSKLPAFNGMDYALRTNVDTIGGSCNAYFTPANGSSINFFRDSAGCNSFAYCGDIIYHEYGHGINSSFYNAAGVTRMFNSALNEGTADVWGMGISNDPVLGKGSFKNGNIIRRYDLTPKVYPQDIEGESHADGEIIAGAWWDLSLNLNSVDSMTDLFAKTYYDVPDGPSGTEGDVYHQVLISALENDDTDNNLTNGTPHFTQILQAFARHGIFLLMDGTIVHDEVNNPPANTPVVINATVNVSEPTFLQGLKLFYKERKATSWDSLVMTTGATSNSFTTSIPGYPAGSIVEYYFSLYDIYNLKNKIFPDRYAPDSTYTYNNIVYQYGVGLNKVWGENFESSIDSGWKIGLPTDDATSGKWVVATPIGSFSNGLPVQPGFDHTTGTASGKCLVTGNAQSTIVGANQTDVDNGITTVITPSIDLTGLNDPIVEYFRWYGNNRGSNAENDMWEVNIKPSISFNFILKVEYTNKSDYNWRRRIFHTKDYYKAANAIQLRFIASDKKDSKYPNSGQSTVEAAIDDIVLYDSSPLGVPSTPFTKAKIYPNPTQDVVYIELEHAQKGKITVSDVTGKELQHFEINETSKQYTISTSQLPNGIYMLMIKTIAGIQLSKITVNHD